MKKESQKKIRFFLNKRAAQIPQGFRLWFISSYLIIAGIITVIINIAFPKTEYTMIANLLTIGAIIFLWAFEIRRELYWKNLNWGQKILGFIFQVLLIIGIEIVQKTSDSLLFYPYLVFSVHFQFGKKGSFPLNFLLAAAIIFRAHTQDAEWLRSSAAVLYIIGRLIFIVFFLVLAMMFQKEEEERKKSERLLKQLEDSNRMLKDYSVQAVNLAAVEERNRIAREIHDSVGHYLTVTNIQLEKAMAYQERDPQEARQAMKDAKWAAAEALKDVRESIHTLREQQDEFSFEEAVNRLLLPNRDGSLKVNIHFEGNYQRFNRTVLMALYRVIQEGLTNVAKHAHARNVDVVCVFAEEQAELVIRDDGKGFDTAALRAKPGKEGGYGLAGVMERLELVNGEMEIKSQLSQGTELTVKVPRELYQFHRNK